RIEAQLRVISDAERELFSVVTRLPVASVVDEQSPLAALATHQARAHVTEAHRGALGVLHDARRDLNELYETHLHAPDDVDTASEGSGDVGDRQEPDERDLVPESAYVVAEADSYIEAALSQLRWYENLIVQARARLEADEHRFATDGPLELVS